MIFKALTPTLSVASQLTEADVAQAARDGFRAIVNNRPDGEDATQVQSIKIARLAAQHGMEYAFVPAVSGKIGADEVVGMAQALARLQTPVLAFCRTGTRSTTLWALTQAQALPAGEIIATAAAAGFDLTALKPQLEALFVLDRAAKAALVDAGSAAKAALA